MVRRAESRWWWAALVCLLLTVGGLPWALGGALPAAAWALCLGATAACACWAVDTLRHGRRLRFHPLLLGLGLMLLVTGLQLIPLPASLLQGLAPRVAELRDFALVPLGLERWRPVTHDAPATWLALGRTAGVLMLAWVSLQLGREKLARRWLAIVIAVDGAAIALCGLAHHLLGVDAFFGLHHFMAALAVITPFGNANHLAAFEAFSAVVAVALALQAERREESIGWSAAALVSMVTVFVSGSRGGSAIGVAVMLMAVATVALQRRARLVWPSVLVLGVLALATVTMWDTLRARADTLTSVEKLQHTKLATWPMMVDTAKASWPLGVGHGAFEQAVTRDQTQQLEVSFTHPENLVLQGLVDYGVPAALLLAALWLWAFGRTWLQTRDDVIERVLLVAVLGAVLHDLFDFALELNALWPAVVALLAVVAGRRVSDSDRSGRSAVLVGLSALAALSLTALWVGHPDARETRQALQARIDAGLSGDDLRAATVEAIDRHPADWPLYALMAEDRAARRKPNEALAWVNRVVFLRPLDARAHVLAGEALQQLKAPTQALIEYKIAFTQGDRTALTEALALCGPQRLCDRVLVPTEGFIEAAYRELRAQQQHDAAREFVQTAIDDPQSQPFQVAEARLLLAENQLEAHDAEGALSSLSTFTDEQPAVVRLRARALVMAGRDDEGLKVLQTQLASHPDDAQSVFTLAELATATQRYAVAHEALKRALPLVPQLRERSEIFRRQAELHELQSHWGLAAEAWSTASRLEPAVPEFLYRLATAREKEGVIRSAIEALKRARAIDTPAHAASSDAWLTRLQRQLNGAPVGEVTP